MKIAILTEYRKEKGIGHCIRCQGILSSFIKRGFDIDLIIDTDEDIKLLSKSIYQIRPWLKIGIDKPYDVFIVDTYSIKNENWMNLNKMSDLIFYLYDGNLKIEFQNIFLIKTAVESKPEGNNPELIGTDYFPLRKEIQNLNKVHFNKKKVLVLFGGTDIRALSVTLSPIFNRYKEYQFFIVTASEDIYNRIEEKQNIHKLLNPSMDIFLELLNDIKFAIISGGTVLYELAYLQIPSIVIEVISNQSEGIKTFKEKGFIEKYFIYNDEELKEKLDKYIYEMITNYEYFKKKAKKGRIIINGKGSEKMVEKIIDIHKGSK